MKRAVLALSLAAIGCAHESAGGSGSKSGLPSISYLEGKAQPPSLMVVHKIQRPLYLVLDPARVRDAVEINAASGHFMITDVQGFVKRDLKEALLAYFERVEVIPAGSTVPKGSFIGDVKIDSLRTHDIPMGMMTSTVLELTWGFAIRPDEAEEYAFSFAGTETSTGAYQTAAIGCAQAAEAAITAMLQKLINDHGIDALATKPQPPSKKRAPTGTTSL
jgi:hypothetical protein